MKEIGRVILEAMIVLIVGTAFSLGANFVSKHRLNITRDYFPPLKKPQTYPILEAQPSPGPAASPATASAPTALETEEQRIKDAGFTPIRYDEVLRMYGDEKYQHGAYVFVDAREEAQFKAGHVPRAWPLNHYDPNLDASIAAVLPVFLSAEKIVLYCEGGNCTDSLFAAGDLRDKGLEAARLYVYAGGFDEWKNHGQPVEKGERMSGDVTAGGGQ